MKFANLLISTGRVVGVIEPTVFGSFVEHLGRSVYDGLYEPTHAKANSQGFRSDVLKVIKDLGVSIVRYPGGNFISQYQWKNGIGPKDKRPANLNLAWHEIEPNIVGIDEMIPEMKAIGCDTMLAFNLGTGSVQDSADLVEYCNLSTSTQYAKMRLQNGHPEPYGITYWCLGNEMDGCWQICHMNAEDYAKKARCLLYALTALYFGFHVEHEDGMLTEAEYDRYAGSHLTNQIERLKKIGGANEAVRNRCFDLLSDYRDLERRMNAELFGLLTAQNDAVQRWQQMMRADMAELPKVLAELRTLGAEAKEEAAGDA